MAGSSWKVAYADFMTAMMAFFLVMWLLNMAPKETLKGMADFFKEGPRAFSGTVAPRSVSNNPLVQYVDNPDVHEYRMSEAEQSNYAIAQALRQFLMKDALPQTATGITSDGLGVLLHVASGLLFQPGTVQLTIEGQKLLQQVIGIMTKYKVYLVVRGHADSLESGAPYSSRWELSSARANAAVRYLVQQGISPSMVRSVAYADTRPVESSSVPGAALRNSRVEFNFHRPEVMSTIVGY